MICMSERSSISIAEVLGDNYYIDKLTSSDYSPSVGDTVTITLLVKDVFGDPATGQTRTVTCTEGSFVSVNGTSITASDSAEVTTGSGGTVTLGLSVSVADNIIVSDGRAECVVSSLSTSITNLATRVKSGKVTGISVQKQNVAGYTVTHNLGRPNVPVATLNIGNSNSYAWGNTQISVYDITNKDFKVKIYNDNENGSFSFNWVVVATD